MEYFATIAHALNQGIEGSEDSLLCLNHLDLFVALKNDCIASESKVNKYGILEESNTKTITLEC
jgi:hypothetical protein